MKSWCLSDNKTALRREMDDIIKKKYDEILEYCKQQYTNEIFENCKHDIVAQLMGVCLTELHQEFGFGEKRLKRFKNGVESLLIMINTVEFAQGKATTQSCIDYIRDKYNIDLDKRKN